MGLLFLNALKGLKKKKVQMIGIIFMVLLSTGIYTTMNVALDRLEDRYYAYLETQNTEHFSFSPVIDYQKDISLETVQNWTQNELKEMNEEDAKIVGAYQICLQKNYDLCGSKSFEYALTATLQKYHVLDTIISSKLKPITEKYDFSYEQEEAKLSTVDQFTYKMIYYNPERKIDRPYVVEGTLPTNKGEITLLPNFAKAHNLSIGDTYKIEGEEYKIVGLAMSPSYIYPLLSMNSPFFDERYNAIIYANKETYDTFDGVAESVYTAKFNHEVNRDDTLKVELIEEGKEMKSKNPATPIFENEKTSIQMDMNTVMRMMRINAIQMEFDIHRKFAEYFLYLLLGVSVFIIVIITKKRIEDERLQIGVLKSLGYKRGSIAASYLVYPIIGSLLGGILGFLLGNCLNEPLAELYLNYFNVPLAGYSLNLKYLQVSVLLPMIVLSVLSFIISLFMLRKKPLDLLKEGSHLKVNLLSKFTNFVTRKLSFESRFRYSLASRSTGKLLIVSLTSFCTGLLIVLTLIGMNLFNSMIEDTFDSFHYKYQVTYKTPQAGGSEEDDLVLSASGTLESVTKGGKVEKAEEDTSISLTGLDSTSKYVELKNKEEQNIKDLLDHDEGVIINANIAEVYKVEVGDQITFTLNDQKYTYRIAGISDGYMGITLYINRDLLSKDLGFTETSYNVKYSVNKVYSSMKKVDKEELSKIEGIFSIEDLRRNMEVQMQTANSSIYIVIAFASLMAFVIIAVIANIVVEENKKTISLMKVLGYKNKEISSIVLNIYTPFVIIAYLLSIPAMIALLKWIVSHLVGDMNMALPISLSPVMAIVGLIGLLIAYYIAILISRRVLNKVPLAVALKRE